MIRYILFVFMINTVYCSTNIVQVVNSTVCLKCSLSEPIQWYRTTIDTKELIIGKKDISLFLDRVSFKNNRHEMIIKNVTFQDAGTYSCNNTNYIEKIELTIIDKSFKCEINRYYLDYYNWELEDKFIILCKLYYSGKKFHTRWINASDSLKFTSNVVASERWKKNNHISSLSVALTKKFNGTSFMIVADNKTFWKSPKMYITKVPTRKLRNRAFKQSYNLQNLTEITNCTENLIINQNDYVEQLNFIIIIFLTCLSLVTTSNFVWIIILYRVFYKHVLNQNLSNSYCNFKQEL